MALSVRMQWDIDASLRELVRLKVPLEGLYVIRREIREGERLLSAELVGYRRTPFSYRDESFECLESVPIETVRLEGSKTNFKRCLSSLLKDRYTEFEKQREILEAGFATG